LGHDPKDVKAAEALIKKKDEDIVALRKQLKFPPSRHPQTAEVRQQRTEEELTNLVLKHNEQLKETEQELEKSLKDKEGESTSQPPNVILVVSTAVTSTLGIALAPNVLAVTTEAVAAKKIASTTQAGMRGLSPDELVKSMEELKLQVTELQKVKEQYATLEQRYDLSKINVAERKRESKGLEQRVKSLEKNLTFNKHLTEIRKILWANITQSINDVWPSIQIIFEQIDLVKAAREEVQKTREELGNMPKEATRLIYFLNTKNKYQLKELGIQDRTGTIPEVKRVLTKRTLMQNLERRCHDMQEEINSFMKKFDILQSKGFPSPLVINEKLMRHIDYVEKLNQYASNQAISSTSASA